jgi:type IV pilus assembly protein PilB
LTFPVALRAVLRQDPDVLMGGEIRDRETAEIAMAAAVTGYLALSTIDSTEEA